MSRVYKIRPVEVPSDIDEIISRIENKPSVESYGPVKTVLSYDSITGRDTVGSKVFAPHVTLSFFEV